MLEFKDVSFSYKKDEEPVLKGLSFCVENKSFVSIIGASGSGKTTIFRLINNLEKADSGEILYDGKPVAELKSYAGYMPQQDLLFPWRTVEKNVMLPMQIKRLPKEQQKKEASRLLEKVGLSEYADKYPAELSGGMRQRVSFARTICTGAELLLLDEPFSALDSITRMALREWLLQQWKSLDKTILFITHDVEEALFLSEKILVLTGRPVNEARLIDVPLPKERTSMMMKSAAVTELKERLVEMLRNEADNEQ